MYHLQVVTPERVVFDGDVVDLVAPGTEGYLGILTDHAPMIATLKPGILNIIDINKNQFAYTITEGFLEVKKNKATVLVETAEFR